MKTKSLRTLGILILTATMLSPQVFAGHDHGGGKMRGGESVSDIFFFKAHTLLKLEDKLGLSKEQAEAIKTLSTEVKKDVVRREAEIQVIKLDLFTHLRNETVDVKAVQALVDQKYEAKKSMEKSVVEAYAKLKGSITAEQWAKFKELKKEFKADFAKHGYKKDKKDGK